LIYVQQAIPSREHLLSLSVVYSRVFWRGKAEQLVLRTQPVCNIDPTAKRWQVGFLFFFAFDVVSQSLLQSVAVAAQRMARSPSGKA
jgi:hypothetical protein